MQTFPVNFSRNPATVWVLIIVPLVIAVACLGPLVFIPRIPDWLLLAVVAVMMIINITVTLAIIKKWVAVVAEVRMDDEGLTVRLLRPSLLYMRRTYTSSWAGISNVSSNVDGQNKRRFYLISFKQPATTINLAPPETVAPDEETAFGAALIGYVDSYNDTHTAQRDTHIGQRGFYDAWWAKLLTVLVYCALAAVIILHFTGGVELPIWRLVQLLAVSAAWLVAYHTNRMIAKRKAASGSR